MDRKQLTEQIRTKKSFLCVGLDPDINKMPEHIKGKEDAIFEFNKAIIDATAPYCVAYKPNLAFYEAHGIKGMVSFEKTIEYLHANYPELFIIADAKRGDIGNTSAMYAKTFFELYGVDALTVAPYMGEDSVTPFLSYAGKWGIVLALNSNKGSMDFQFTCDEKGERLFEKVLKKCCIWGNDTNIMCVVGATQGSFFKEVREIVPNHFLLVPGVGAQGGNLQEVCKYGIIHDCGLLVNSSRGIIYASNGEDYAEAAGQKAQELQKEMCIELEKYHCFE
ncbi:MAG: orotidine-5'-phosphate decarboxylase [Prevotella sp.]